VLSFAFFFQAFSGFGNLFAEQFWCLHGVLIYLDIIAEGDGWSFLASTLTHTWLYGDIIIISVEYCIPFETVDDIFAVAFGATAACTDLHGDEWHGEVMGNM
jgi:hypothetical protein